MSNESKERLSNYEKIVAEVVGERIIVWDPQKGSKLYAEGFYGKPIGIRKPKTPIFEKPLELSILEALYLLEKGRIKIIDENGKELSFEELKNKFKDIHEKLEEKYIVYRDLRDKGYVVRPGMKFGADFAVYEHGPGIDHAPFLVHVLPFNVRISPIEIVRAGRLATTVRKKFVIATVTLNKKPIYYVFSWMRL
ncbi:MAG: tRNA-intron lyase [Candidatus Baldrarchaeia archaeon]